MRPGLVDILEASYRFDRDDETWMRCVGETVNAHLGFGLGAVAIRYKIGPAQQFQPQMMVPVDLAPGAVEVVARATANLPSSYVSQTFASMPCDMASNTGPADVKALTTKVFRDQFEPMGWKDALNVNGLDPTSEGLLVATWLPKKSTMTPALRVRWSRVAAHLAAANRLRNRVRETGALPPESADAILTALGRIEHARPAAQSFEARAELNAAARAVDHARGALRRTDPDLALSEWKALVSARWTLVDHFESDGKRYILARRNEAVRGGFRELAPRERQALGFASLGHSNKLIAYEMGISASTVSVLLCRAAKKLGTKSRAALIATYLASSGQS